MHLIEDLFSLFHRHGEDLFFVGGFVRDRILGKPTGDIDLATSSLPEKSAELLELEGFRAIPVGMEFGTIGTFVHRAGKQVEVQITTYRSSESYRSGSRHLPDSSKLRFPRLVQNRFLSKLFRWVPRHGFFV